MLGFRAWSAMAYGFVQAASPPPPECHKVVCTLPLGVLQRSVAHQLASSASASAPASACAMARRHPCPSLFESKEGCVHFEPPLSPAKVRKPETPIPRCP